MRHKSIVRIGCAGWTIPAAAAAAFPGEGSHLERYSAQFNCVEINSTFYRSHLPSTYERWAASVPARFRFSLKMPRSITHDARLAGAGVLVRKFVAEASLLGRKLGCILVQLPPSLVLDRRVAARFLQVLRRSYDGDVALEPRHPSWFSPEAELLLARYEIGRVRADPPVVVGEPTPIGPAYFRYHGSPRIYYSSYSDARLADLARSIAKTPQPVWCIFDNTTLGAATANARTLRGMTAGNA